MGECFVCFRPRAPRIEAIDVEPRAACAAHRQQARLANGVFLEELCASRPPGSPLEGSGLGYLLNPVTIASVRCFSDWAAGGWAVVEEVFPSRSFFEYSVLHVPRLVRALLSLRDPSSSAAAIGELLDRLRAQRRVDAELARRGLAVPSTADEALDVWQAALARPAPQIDLGVEMPRLLALAALRSSAGADSAR